jgi:hypothetical protein
MASVSAKGGARAASATVPRTDGAKQECAVAHVRPRPLQRHFSEQFPFGTHPDRHSGSSSAPALCSVNQTVA